VTTWDRLHLSLTALSLVATLTLFTCDELHPLIVAAASCLLPFSFLLRRTWLKVPSWGWDILTLGAFSLLLPLARSNLFLAAAYFVLFLQLVKAFSVRRLSDAYSIYIISLFEIVVASAVTTSLFIAPLLLMYVVLLIRAFLIQNIAGACYAAVHWEILQRLPNASRRTITEKALLELRKCSQGTRTSTLSFHVVLLFILVTSMSIVFFMLVPRFSLRKYVPPLVTNRLIQPTSAFDENIEFGGQGRIHLDNRIALYVRPLEGATKPQAIRLRGVALDRFDGQKWERSTWATHREAFAKFTVRPYPIRKNLIVQTPNTSRFIFGETFPTAVLTFDFKEALYTDPFAGATWLLTVPSREIHYTVASRVEDLADRADPELYKRPVPRENRETTAFEQSQDRSSTAPFEKLFDGLRREVESRAFSAGRSSHMTPSESRIQRNRREIIDPQLWTGDYIASFYKIACLQIPDTIDTQSLSLLARQITAEAQTDYARALSVETYLRKNYTYSLDVNQAPQKRFLDDFLFRSKRGHCEYFATAMVMLLRSLGIPARIVNGYYSTEWNNLAGMFTVRNRDAHSWVEAYFDRYGWMTFDPTPPGALERQVDINPVYLTLSRLFDALKLKWYSAVIDFSIQDQRLVAYTVLSTIMGVGRLFGEWKEDSLLPQGNTDSSGQENSAIAIGIGVFCLVAIILATRRFLGFAVHKQGRAASRQRSMASLRFYEDLLQRLEAYGFVREPHETPFEFASRVAKNECLQCFQTITDWYYCAKYGHRDLSPAQLDEIERFRRSLNSFRSQRK